MSLSLSLSLSSSLAFSFLVFFSCCKYFIRLSSFLCTYFYLATGGWLLLLLDEMAISLESYHGEVPFARLTMDRHRAKKHKQKITKTRRRRRRKKNVDSMPVLVSFVTVQLFRNMNTHQQFTKHLSTENIWQLPTCTNTYLLMSVDLRQIINDFLCISFVK